MSDSRNMKHYDGMKLAEKLFDVQIKQMLFDGELSDILETFTKPFDYSYFAYDYYDGCLGIYGVPDTYKLCGEDAVKLKEAGFHGVWTHTVQMRDHYDPKKPRNVQGERYYNL